MSWLSFVAFNAGAALWVGVWSAVGYLAGSHIDAIYTPASYALLALTGAIILALAVRYLYRRNRHGHSDEHEVATPD